MTSTIKIKNPNDTYLRPKIENRHKTPLHQPPTPPPPTYERQATNTAEIKFVNDRYITPVTIKFGSFDSNNSVNRPMKHRKLFVALEFLDTSILITINDTTINHPKSSPWGPDILKHFKLSQIRI